jgi:predicted ester cyclase
MPPALFTVGNLDPLRDDALLLAGRWEFAGGRADLEVWPEGAHAFTNMGTPLGEIALTRTIEWISDLLSPPAAPAAVVRRFIDEVVNGGDVSAADDLWAPDLVWHGGSMGDVHGLDAFREHLRANAGGAFTGMHLTIDDLIEADGKVVVRFTNGGTQSGPFMGAPASGKSARWLGIGIYAVAAGKIQEAWFGEDILGMLLQLGVITLPS